MAMKIHLSGINLRANQNVSFLIQDTAELNLKKK